jgi:uncharacterized protein YegL
MIDAVNTFTQQFKAKAMAGSRLGVITFSGGAVWHKELSTDLSVSLDDTFPSWNAGGTFLHSALDLAREGDLARRRVVLTFTDGRPTHEVQATAAAAAVRNVARLAMVAIGLSKDETYMRSLVSRPEQQNYYPIENFGSLSSEFVDLLTKDVCQTPSPTPALTPSPPTPPPTQCDRDTRGACSQFGGLCFSETRGDTYCNRETGTCWCSLSYECAFNRSIALTKGGQWGVCRKHVNETRGEDNALHWAWLVAKDIMIAYGKALTGSGDYPNEDDNDNQSLLSSAEQSHLYELLSVVVPALHVFLFLHHIP